MKIVDPFRDERSAYKFHMDTITYSVRSIEGSRYETVLRCEASHHFISFYLRFKSDLIEQFRDFLKHMREDHLFKMYPYQIMCIIRMDNDGVWSHIASNWNELRNEFGIQCEYVAKDDDRDAATAESACGIVESMAKKILIRMNLCPTWWQRCSRHGKWLLNRLPTMCNLSMASPDGDRPTPIELFTRFWYSRERVRKELCSQALPGSLLLVKRKQSGATLKQRARWLVAKYMLGDQVVAFDPWTMRDLKVKAFRVMPMPDGCNFDDYLGTNVLKKAMRSTMPMPMDHLDVITCELPQMNLMKRHVAKLPTSRDMVKVMKEGRLLELVSKDVLADAGSDSEEEDAAYAEEEKSLPLPSKEYTLTGDTGEAGNSTDAQPPGILELAPLRSVAGHSVEDTLMGDCNKTQSTIGYALPTIASGRGPQPPCHDGCMDGIPSGARGTEPWQLGPIPVGRRAGVKSLPNASEVEETEAGCGPLPIGVGLRTGCSKPAKKTKLRSNPLTGGGISGTRLPIRT